MSPDDSTVLFRAIPTSFKLSLQEKRLLTEFAKMLLSELTSGRPFSCLITSDSALRRLNRKFLQHDYPTDVLSFPSDEPGMFGELAVSIERAAEQAKELGHSTMEELKVLMLHGVLHLTGMDHETDKGAMAKAEAKWRKHFGLPATLIERVQQWA